MNIDTAFQYFRGSGVAAALALAASLVAGGCQTPPSPVAATPRHMQLVDRAAFLYRGRLNPAAYHAQALADGDYRASITTLDDIPYHIHILIAIGQDAGPFLVQLLSCTDVTPTEISGGTFGPGLKGSSPLDRRAAVADLAQYALRSIYTPSKVDEPYQPVNAARIKHWRDVVEKAAAPGRDRSAWPGR